MNDRYRTASHPSLEELVHEFLDGELPIELQAKVFTHLAECARCRELVHRVMRFRQMSRQEYLPVPPAVDEEFFRKLELQKVQSARHDRSEDRRPLWQRRRLISLRTAVVLGAIMLSLGLFLPPAEKKPASSLFVRAETETVEFRDVIYVIYPGLTIEATRL